MKILWKLFGPQHVEIVRTPMQWSHEQMVEFKLEPMVSS